MSKEQMLLNECRHMTPILSLKGLRKGEINE